VTLKKCSRQAENWTSTETTQRDPQKVFTSSRKLDEWKPPTSTTSRSTVTAAIFRVPMLSWDICQRFQGASRPCTGALSSVTASILDASSGFGRDTPAFKLELERERL